MSFRGAPRGQGRRRKPAAWDTTKSEYFLKWDAIKGEQIPKESMEFFITVKEKISQPFDDEEHKCELRHTNLIIFSCNFAFEACCYKDMYCLMLWCDDALYA